MGYITTYTGKHIDPMAPDPNLFDIKDIAHALSLVCRGNGHVSSFYSVAQHCISCAEEARLRGYTDRVALACLLHDACEIYLSDIPRPFKQMLPAYREAEESMLSLVYSKFLGNGITDDEAAKVKEIDDAMLYYDLRDLLSDCPSGTAPEIHMEISRKNIPFVDVENRYVELFCELSKGLSDG